MLERENSKASITSDRIEGGAVNPSTITLQDPHGIVPLKVPNSPKSDPKQETMMGY